MTSEALHIFSRIPRFAGRSFARLEIARLGGLTNRAYKIVADSDAFVLRMPGQGTERHIDRRQEFANMRIAESIGLAPEIIHFDSDSGVLVTRFVDGGVVLSPAAMGDRAILKSAIAALRRLHRCGQAFAGILDPFAKLDRYADIANQARTVEMSVELSTVLAEAQSLRNHPAREPSVLAPCHVDPSPENMIMRVLAGERSVVMVDWEYSAMCDPMWDLADFSMESGLTDGQDLELLDIYFGSADSKQVKQLRQFKSICCLIGAAWALMQAALTGRPAEFMTDYAADMEAYRRHAD